MKKLIFVVALVLGLALALNAAFAETDPEYAAALKLYNSRQYNRAAEQLKEYVKKNPTPAAYYLLGYALYKVGSFDEANEYFKEAYLLDPDFSLEKAGLIQKHPEEKVVKTEEERISEPQKPSAPETKAVEPEPQKETAPVAKLPEIKPIKPAPPKEIPPITAPAPSPVPAPAPMPREFEPQKQPGLPPGMPSFPMSPKGVSGAMPQAILDIIAKLGIIILIISVVISIYSALCHFLIAKKLNVPAAWLAFLTLAALASNALSFVFGPEFFMNNKMLALALMGFLLLISYIGFHWPIVGSAGKAWWWMLLPIPVVIIGGILFIIPIIGWIAGFLLIVGFYVYLYMRITENLGKNKWLGLLIIVPIINLGFLGFLAFSSAAEIRSDTAVLEAPTEEQE